VSSIQNLLFQVWNDLRARRLVPVAVLLVAGLVAAPVVLSKGSDEPAAETVAPATGNAQANRPAGPEELARVKLDEGLEPGSGSSLSAFDADDPFSPPEKVLAAAREASDDGAMSDGAQTGTNAPDTGGTSPDTGGGTTTGGDTTGGDTTGGDTTGGDGTGDGKQNATQYQYVLDVTFWANGRRRKIEGLKKLDILPNEASPLLIFMGVTERAGNGVFLVDSTLDTTGEGRCKPSRADCAFLYLGPGSEQEFTNEAGDSYRLRIDEIRKVKVGANPDGDAAASSAKSGAAAQAAVEPRGRFSAFPELVDVIEESGQLGEDSSSAETGR
jgi:hypothetical protein